MARKRRRKRRWKGRALLPLLLLALAAAYFFLLHPARPLTLEEVPPYSGAPYAEVHGGVPDFRPEDLSARSYERYGFLDLLGRCTVCTACVGRDLMPTESREDIGSVHPTGWEQAGYDFIDGGLLYNRCHLIGFQLTGENANDRNLITGTRYLNIEGMLPFENLVADYVKETGNHVLYRVTPVFDGLDLLARGVQLEALSVEDGGAGVCFNVFCYNVQPGVELDYATGKSRQADLPEAGTSNIDQTRQKSA